MEIREIRLSGALPSVFSGEDGHDSDVWLSSIMLRKGGRYLIAAESGTGKSSLCAFIYGSRTDYEGSISFNDTDIRSLDISAWQEIRRKNLAYLPQDLALFPELTALENIKLKNDLTGHLSPERIDEMLELLGIDARRDFPVGRMSVGQQQRVGIIRALAQPFDFILLDEPVSHLDARNNMVVAALVDQEATRQGAAVISTSVGNHLMLDNSETIAL